MKLTPINIYMLNAGPRRWWNSMAEAVAALVEAMEVLDADPSLVRPTGGGPGFWVADDNGQGWSPNARFLERVRLHADDRRVAPTGRSAYGGVGHGTIHACDIPCVGHWGIITRQERTYRCEVDADGYPINDGAPVHGRELRFAPIVGLMPPFKMKDKIVAALDDQKILVVR